MVTSLQGADSERVLEECVFKIRRNGRAERLTYQQVYAAGHRAWLNGSFHSAQRLFEEMSAAVSCGPRVEILRAHCLAMQSDFSGCSSVLHHALPSEQYGDAAGQLHDLFVLWKVGLLVEVKSGLQQLISEHPDLPVLSLLLADLLQMSGAYALSEQFLRRAIDGDSVDGAIAFSAGESLRKLNQN
jgi:thioredoxin-like negative regulator of GroEL